MAFLGHYKSKFTSILIFLITLTILFCSNTLSLPLKYDISRDLLLDEDRVRHAYEQWIANYSRIYSSNDEKEHRFFVFKQNFQFIEASNNANNNRTYKLAINDFADMTYQEFLGKYTGFKKPLMENVSYTPFMYENVTKLPSTIDWRSKGVVTPIKDQKTCGSCWAFSAVAAVEGINKISGRKLISLSEQELVDCDKNDVNIGCQGGEIDAAFKFIIKKGGLVPQKNYPYKATDNKCNKTGTTNPIAKISGYQKVPIKTELALQKASANQPISVAIEAADDFRFYGSGVYNGECGSDVNHAVTVVGYGVTAKDRSKYWLIKNSWGVRWGEKGYIRMKRGVKAKGGICGITTRARYPIIK